jgi:hypothetical protein
LEYLDYLRQPGILLQTFTCSSVFSLDHLHRQFVFETGARWNLIESTFENSILKKKEDASRYQASQPRRSDAKPNAAMSSVAAAPRLADNSNRVCWLYNLYKGCHYGDTCTYPHVCSVDGCSGNHPDYKHNDATHKRPKPGAAQFKQSSSCMLITVRGVLN